MTTYSFVGVDNGTLLEVAEPDFVKIINSNGSTITVADSKLNFNHVGTDGGVAVWAVDAGSTEHICEVVLGSDYTTDAFPVACRVVSRNTYIGARISSGNKLDLISVNSATQTTLYSRTVSRTSADTIKLEADGDNFRLYFNGALEESSPGSGYTATKITTAHDASTLAGIVVRDASRAAAISQITIAALPSGPSINPTGTDVTAYPGQTRTAVMQNVVATPNAIAYVYNDTIVSTHTDFDWTAGDAGAGTITYTVAQGELPYGNTDLVIRVSFDSGDPVTLAGMALTVEPDFQYVVAAGTLVTETEESIWYGYEEDTPVAGYQTHLPLETLQGRPLTLDPTGTWVAGEPPEPTTEEDSFPVRVWDFVEWHDYTVTVNLEGGEPGEATILTVGTLRIGGTAAVTVGGFGGTVNAGTLDGVALTSASPTSITIPALVDTEEVPRPGMRDLTLTDGDDSDTVSREVLPPAGWSSYAIEEGFAESINGVAKEYLPEGWAAGDFIVYPSSGNNADINGVTKFNAGTQEFFLIDNATNVATAFDVVTTSSFTGGGGSDTGVTVRGFTVRGF